jgi:hypothetical protein
MNASVPSFKRQLFICSRYSVGGEQSEIPEWQLFLKIAIVKPIYCCTGALCSSSTYKSRYLKKKKKNTIENLFYLKKKKKNQIPHSSLTSKKPMQQYPVLGRLPTAPPALFILPSVFWQC